MLVLGDLSQKSFPIGELLRINTSTENAGSNNANTSVATSSPFLSQVSALVSPQNKTLTNNAGKSLFFVALPLLAAFSFSN